MVVVVVAKVASEEFTGKKSQYAKFGRSQYSAAERYEFRSGLAAYKHECFKTDVVARKMNIRLTAKKRPNLASVRCLFAIPSLMFRL